MALKLSDATVTNGVLIPVYNTEKKTAESKAYYAVWVEDLDGKNERCLLFTHKEKTNFNKIQCDLKDHMVLGRLYIIDSDKSRFVLFKHEDEEFVLRLTNTLRWRAQKRAWKNTEDQPQKNLFVDIFD